MEGLETLLHCQTMRPDRKHKKKNKRTRKNSEKVRERKKVALRLRKHEKEQSKKNKELDRKIDGVDQSFIQLPKPSVDIDPTKHVFDRSRWGQDAAEK